MTILGKGVGVLMKNSGSGSPSYVLEEVAQDEIVHPFKLTVRKSGENFKVFVRAGTVNNLVPKIGSTYLDAVEPPFLTISNTATHRIYLKAMTGATPIFFPDTCEVVAFPNDQTDTDEDGYLLIGNVVINEGRLVSVNQFVYASQVVVRAKPGSATALWSWSSR